MKHWRECGHRHHCTRSGVSAVREQRSASGLRSLVEAHRRRSTLLPEDALRRVFSFLAPEDLVRAGAASREWSRIARSEWLWQRCCERDVLPRAGEKGSATWRDHYRQAREEEAKWRMLQCSSIALHVHHWTVEAMACWESSEERRIRVVSGSWDGSVVLSEFDAESCTNLGMSTIKRARGMEWVSCIADSEGWIAAATTGGEVCAWRKGHLMEEPAFRCMHPDLVTDCRVVSALRVATPCVVTASTGGCVRAFALGNQGKKFMEERAHEDAAWRCLALSSNEMCSMGRDGRVCLFRLGDGTLATALQETSAIIDIDAFTLNRERSAPSKSLLAAGLARGSISLYTAGDGELKFAGSFPGHAGGVCTLAFCRFPIRSADPSRTPRVCLVSGGRDRTCRVWCVRSGECVAKLPDAGGCVTRVAQCGRILAVLAPGDVLLYYNFLGRPTREKEVARLVEEAGNAPRAGPRRDVVRARREQKERDLASGFELAHRLMEGQSHLSQAASLSLHPSALAIGTSIGAISLLSFSL